MSSAQPQPRENVCGRTHIHLQLRRHDRRGEEWGQERLKALQQHPQQHVEMPALAAEKRDAQARQKGLAGRQKTLGKTVSPTHPHHDRCWKMVAPEKQLASAAAI